jgi:hypothetical protein
MATTAESSHQDGHCDGSTDKVSAGDITQKSTQSTRLVTEMASQSWRFNCSGRFDEIARKSESSPQFLDEATAHKRHS